MAGARREVLSPHLQRVAGLIRQEAQQQAQLVAQYPVFDESLPGNSQGIHRDNVSKPHLQIMLGFKPYVVDHEIIPCVETGYHGKPAEIYKAHTGHASGQLQRATGCFSRTTTPRHLPAGDLPPASRRVDDHALPQWAAFCYGSQAGRARLLRRLLT